MAKRKKNIPKKLFVVFGGDDNSILTTSTAKAAATRECRSYNNLSGYKHNCFVLTFVPEKKNDG